MRYADTLLTEGESVVMRTRQHWLALLSRARAALFLFVIGILLIGRRSGSPSRKDCCGTSSAS